MMGVVYANNRWRYSYTLHWTFPCRIPHHSQRNGHWVRHLRILWIFCTTYFYPSHSDCLRAGMRPSTIGLRARGRLSVCIHSTLHQECCVCFDGTLLHGEEEGFGVTMDFVYTWCHASIVVMKERGSLIRRRRVID